jgi:dethiobiotin synthetase
MKRYIVAGIGTDVGKTVVSGILLSLLQADYWKPVECGESDTLTVSQWIDPSKQTVFPPTYSFPAPVSPHMAGQITIENIVPPTTSRPLVIESVGGIFVPLTSTTLTINLFQSWNYPWIIVSRHYLGSINHTLLTLHALRKFKILGLIFNGEPNSASEEVILHHFKLPVLGRLLPEPSINKQTIERYAKEWKKCFFQN